MSLEAQAWAWRQVLPLKPKHVLVALGDQADERTGHVCYGRSDLDYLARKCSLARRSLSRIIGALILNEYLRRESGKGKGKSSQYWLRMGRPLAESPGEFQWTSDKGHELDAEDSAEIADPQDVEGWAKLAHPPGGEKEGADPGQIGPGGGPIRGPSRVLDNNLTISTRVRVTAFDPQAQALEIEAFTTKRAAEAAGAKSFVIEGTPAWNAWCAYRKKDGGIGSLPRANGIGKHAGKTGWYMPTLFPPGHQHDSAPKTPDEKFIAQNGGL